MTNTPKLIPLLNSENIGARGSGRTTKQMQMAPKGAIYIVPRIWSRRDYYHHLANKIGREDLQIRSMEWIDKRAWQGLEYSALIVDHDVVLYKERCSEEAGSFSYCDTRTTANLREALARAGYWRAAGSSD